MRLDPVSGDRALGARMPIDDSGKGFLATDAAILVDAFDGALKKLEVDRTDPEALVVAKHLISVAKAGERDPVRLRDLTVKAVRTERRRVRAVIPGRVLRSLTTGFWANPFLWALLQAVQRRRTTSRTRNPSQRQPYEAGATISGGTIDRSPS